jgi:hypothetical protein
MAKVKVQAVTDNNELYWVEVDEKDVKPEPVKGNRKDYLKTNSPRKLRGNG